ncbi:MAG TPA: acylphosphatase [Steroidobacteraceae bacterium]|nr:acylphosphatase [Steroidobacteraceae bacterium]
MVRTIRRFLVTGKVQGVFFRHSTRVEARRLKLHGFARNLPDGSVEVVARGAAAEVEQLHAWLHRGPAQARVDAVRETEVDPESTVEEEFGVL